MFCEVGWRGEGVVGQDSIENMGLRCKLVD